jgi:hypothetical protein
MVQKIRFFLFLTLMLSCSSVGFAQRQNKKSMSEFGFMGGGMYYIGDLNSFNHFKNTNFSGGLLYRYNIHSRLSIRANVIAGSVNASDEGAKEAIVANRNLSFQSKIYEVAGGLEFNYFPFQLGHDRYKGTAYLLAQIGLFHMNPTTNFNGDVIELQSLGTEGQGTALSSKNFYSKTQLCIPLGIGAKLSLGKKASVNFEYGIRKTFTDYLDDVGAARYVDPAELAAVSGPLAAQLSNRSLDGNRFGRRGNPTTKDWYTFFGVMFTFRLGKPDTCYNH